MPKSFTEFHQVLVEAFDMPHAVINSITEGYIEAINEGITLDPVYLKFCLGLVRMHSTRMYQQGVLIKTQLDWPELEKIDADEFYKQVGEYLNSIDASHERLEVLKATLKEWCKNPPYKQTTE